MGGTNGWEGTSFGKELIGFTDQWSNHWLGLGMNQISYGSTATFSDD